MPLNFSLLRALKFVICIMAAVINFSLPSYAFYEYQGEQNSIDLRGLIRLFGVLNVNPDNKKFYVNDSDLSAGGIGRLLLDTQIGEHVAIEFNGYQFIISNTASSVIPDSHGTFPVDVERSSALEWKQHDGQQTKASLAVDRLNLGLSHSNLDVTLGRQPVNLATVFYFTPNDFFGPFTAQTFYRVYKSGVDAARLEVQLGELSQLSLINVLGYDPDSSSSNGWSDNPALDRSSFLARIAATAFNFEWALLGGKVSNKDIIGASLQGDLFEWLGLRAEGHYSMPENNSINNYAEFTIGLEHKFPNDFDLRGEIFHHGSGADSTKDYDDSKLLAQCILPYRATWYTAIGVGYQATPLLQIGGVAITNLVDGSNLLSFNSIYSLSDESELSFGFIIPIGKNTPTNSNSIQSEFGLYPYSTNIEFRRYF